MWWAATQSPISRIILTSCRAESWQSSSIVTICVSLNLCSWNLRTTRFSVSVTIHQPGSLLSWIVYFIF